MESYQRLCGILFLILSAVAIVGCSNDSKLDELKRELASLQNELTSLKTQIAWLDTQRKIDELFDNKIAYLTPGAEGYSVVKFDLGALTVHITNVREYANGSQVTLQFGNTLASTITGLKATVEYGQVDGESNPLNDETKEKEITFSKPLISGSWTNVNIVLDGIPFSKLGFLRLKGVSHTGIRLSQ